MENKINLLRQEYKQKLIKAYNLFHCNSSEHIQNYVNDITAYIGNCFFAQIIDDIENNQDAFKNPNILREDWLRKLFSEGESHRTIRQAHRTAIDEYLILGEKIYHQHNNYMITQDDPINDYLGLEESDDILLYFDKIIEEFGELRLDIVGFRLPIESFIQLPLLKNDKELRTERSNLYQKKIQLENKKDENRKLIKKIAHRIKEIKFILNEEHQIFDVLSLGKDIFIEADAGAGKSTILKWLTYKIASENNFDQPILPIYVELKYYTSRIKSLDELVRISLRNYGLNLDDYREYKMFLFLDAYDEYIKNGLTLLKEIIDFRKRNHNSQIVFTGRSEPNFSAHNIDFVSYTLGVLKEKDIETLFKKFIGKDQYLFYFEKIKQLHLRVYLYKPLYVVFIMSLIKRYISQPSFSLEEIESVICNRGKLFYKLIVEDFIEKYESKSTTDIEKWKYIKQIEINAITSLAYYLTVTLENQETISLGNAINYLDKNVDLHSNIPAEQLLLEFRNHNILALFNSELSFSKKEFRVFFASLKLVGQIHSVKHYNTLKKSFTNISQGDDLWRNLMEYCHGIIDSEFIIDASLFPVKLKRVLLTKEWFAQLDRLLESLDQRNYPSKSTYITREYLHKLIIKVLYDYKEYRQADTPSLIYLSWQLLLRKLIINFPWIKKYFKNETIYNINIHYLSWNEHVGYMRYNNLWLFDRFRENQLGMSVVEFAKLYPKITVGDGWFNQDYYYFSRIFKESSTITFPKKEVLYITYLFSLQRRGAHEFKSIFKKQASIESGLAKRLRPYFSDFILYFYKKTLHPNYVAYYRLLTSLKGIGWSFSINETTHLPDDVLDKLVGVFAYGSVHLPNDQRNAFNYYIANLVENIEYKPLKIKLSQTLKNTLINDKEKLWTRVRAAINLILLGEENHVKFLKDQITGSNTILRSISKLALVHYFERTSLNAKTHSSQHLIDIAICAISQRPINKKLCAALLKNIRTDNDDFHIEVLTLLDENNNKKIAYSLLLYFNINFRDEPKTVRWLTSFFGTYYGTWCYNTLSSNNLQYYFDYKSHFKVEYLTIYLKFKAFQEDSSYEISTSDLREMFYLGDRELLNLLQNVLANKEHHKILRHLEYFSSLKSMLEEKVVRIERYKKSQLNNQKA